MKSKLCLVLFFVLLTSLSSFAAPLCVRGTLASYIALGSGGCAFNDGLYANFSYQSTVPLSTATGVIVEPVGPGPIMVGAPKQGMNFLATWKTPAGASQQVVISYTVQTINPITSTLKDSIVLDLGQATISGIIGSVTVTETTNVGTLTVDEHCADACSLKQEDSLQFTPVNVLHVTDTVSLVGGNGGVSLDGFDANFVLCPACPQPL